jgi:hypothetical protein
MLSKSVELLIAIAPKAPTWRASCQCLTTDSLSRGYSGQLFELRHVLELDGECRDSRFILVRALDRDRVITIRPVGVSLLRWIDCVVLSLVTGVPTPFLYIDRESCGVVTILVVCKEGVLNYIQKLLSIGIRLVWPILLGLGVVDATPLLAPVGGPGPGPRLVVISLGNPVGLASTLLNCLAFSLKPNILF